MSIITPRFGDQNSGDSATNAAEFENLLRSGMDDLMVKTSLNQDTWDLGQETQWFLDQGSGELIFTFADSVVSAPAQVIGTWDQDSGVWTWAWADAALPEHLQADAYRVREYGLEHGFRHLIEACWEAEESHCWYMTGLASWLCGAKGAYRGVTDGICSFITFGEVTRDAVTAQAPEVSAENFLSFAAEDFRNSSSSPEQQREACCRYLRRGVLQGMDQSELIHQLGLAAPSVLDIAGYSPEAAQGVMDLLKTISDEEIERCETDLITPDASSLQDA